MYITTLKAIEIAIDAIRQLPNTEENLEAIKRLEGIRGNDRIIKWTKEMVFERLNEWKVEHGRNPTVTSLIEPGMPKAVTVQRLFDMRASAFLSIYYPKEDRKPCRNKYSTKTYQEWIDIFVEQYENIRPKSSREYNGKRDKSTPTWYTIARYLNVYTWNELIKLTEVDTSCLTTYCPYDINKEYTVNSTSSLYEKLEKILS